VLAAAVRIYAGLEADVGAVISRDDRPCVVTKVLRLAAGQLLRIDLSNIRVAKIDT
jgi:hypothetical protein